MNSLDKTVFAEILSGLANLILTPVVMVLILIVCFTGSTVALKAAASMAVIHFAEIIAMGYWGVKHEDEYTARYR